MTTINVAIDHLKDNAIADLLNAHLKEMQKYSPSESIHALTTGELKHPDITFWSARMNNEIAGCGALKTLSVDSGEIKSMKTHANFLRRGVAAKILQAIITEAKDRRYKTLYLETGTHQAFNPAIQLYMRHGFVQCPPFGDYQLDPHSSFYCKWL